MAPVKHQWTGQCSHFGDCVFVYGVLDPRQSGQVSQYNRFDVPTFSDGHRIKTASTEARNGPADNAPNRRFESIGFSRVGIVVMGYPPHRLPNSDRCHDSYAPFSKTLTRPDSSLSVKVATTFDRVEMSSALICRAPIHGA